MLEKLCGALLLLMSASCSGQESVGGRPAEPTQAAFDGERAYSLLVRQTEFGPRNPGSTGHEAAKAFLLEELRSHADTAYAEPFTYYDEKADTAVSLTNLIGEFNPQLEERILLCAHWDTRPYADRDPDPAVRNTPILGANDGASGVAVLLEMARILGASDPGLGVDIVLFDGEDYGRGIGGDVSDYFLGAREFARKRKGHYRPRMGLLLDMIGDRDLNVHVERFSVARYPDVVAQVWNAAEAIGLKPFHREPKYAIQDDHLPLMEAGMPVICLIDFDYPHWHTMEDTADKCSPESLQVLGDLLVFLLYRQ